MTHREIKFRAWDKIAKMFVQVSWGFDIDNSGTLYPCMTQPETDLVLMQYTGIKDKNGVPIFEGDVIKLTANSKGKLGTASKEWTVVVLWEEQSASFVLKAEFCSWTFSETDFNGFPFIKEVIGNIYENPELLQN